MAAKLHFLIIDDDEVVLEEYARLVNKGGHEVTTLTSSAKALEKINEIREHYTTPARLRTVEQTMGLLAGTKSFVDKFFDNVKVNDENEQIKKNRLELLFLLCKTFDSFADFSKIEV